MASSKTSGKDEKPFYGLSPFGVAFFGGLGLLLIASAFLFGQLYIFVRSDKDEVKVPDIVDQSLTSAEKALHEVKLKLTVEDYKYSDTIDKDHIIQHNPAAGTTVREGRNIYATLSLGRRDIKTPNLLGKDVDTAKAELEALGLAAGEPEGVYNDDAPLNSVVNQTPGPGAMVASGEKIGITYSKGPESLSVEMPDLTGMTLADALTRVDELGLKVSRITRTYSESAASESVTSQAPIPGKLIKRGNEVILTATLPITEKKLGEREFRIAVNVPASEMGTEVRIIKSDLNETVEIYRDIIKGPARVEKKIEAYGTTKVSIYFDGELVREETF